MAKRRKQPEPGKGATGPDGRRFLPSFLPLPILLIVLLAGLFLGRQLLLGLSLVPLDLLGIITPWKLYSGPLPPVENPLLDSLQQYYPRRVTFNESLAAGWLPLWNPDVYCGIPFLATQQSAVLYPPAWLLAAIPAAQMFGVSALLHLAVAGGGMYLLLSCWPLRREASMAGAVAFAFNGFVVVWLAYPNVTQWTWCWLPAILWCWLRGSQSSGWLAARWWAAAALLLGVQFTGGHAQVSSYVLIAFLAGAVGTLPGGAAANGPLRRWRRAAGLAALAAVTAAGLGLAAGHLLPAWEYVPQTDRAARVPWDGLAANAFPFPQLVAFLVPRFFGDGTLADGYWYGGRLAFVEMTFYPGVVALVFAIAGAAVAFRLWGRSAEPGRPDPRGRLASICVILIVLGLLMAFRTPFYWLLWRVIPGFGQYTAIARAFCLSGFGIAGLAALGVEAMLGGDRERRLAGRAAGGGAAALLVLLIVALTVEGPGVIAAAPQLPLAPGRTLILLQQAVVAALYMGAGVCIAAASVRRRLPDSRLGIIAAGAVAADLFAFGAIFNPATNPAWAERTTPELEALARVREPYRFISYGQQGHPAAFRDRMSPNLPSVYRIPDVNGSDSFFPLRYLDTLRAARPDALDHDCPEPGAPIFRALGARYLVRPGEPPPGFRRVAGALWENPEALPYARVHLRARVVPGVPALLAALPTMDPRVALVSVSADREFWVGGRPEVIPLRVQREGPGRLRLEGSAPAPGLAVVAESYNAGWRARVNGRPAPVAPVDHLMIGVPTPSGALRVELRYEPPSVRAGLFVSLAVLAMLAGIMAGGLRAGSRTSSSRPEGLEPPTL